MEVALTFAASLSEANTLIAYTTIAAMVVVICYSRHRKPTLSNSIAAIVKAVRVPEAKIVGERMFPLTLSPSNQEAATQADRLAFVREHRIELLELVRTHGAVLLRGWGPCSSQHFAEVTKALGMTASEMSCSAGPRFEVAENVFTANEAPPSERIPFHHEMAQCDGPPSVVLFFCEVAASHGGATPIIRSHLAAKYLREKHPEVAARLADKGVRYVRIMPPVTDPSSALGKSWRHSLRVDTPAQAEDALSKLGSRWRWLAGANLHTVTKAMPALLHDERTGCEVFFTAAESTFNAVEDEALDVDARTTDATPPHLTGFVCLDGADDSAMSAPTPVIRPVKAIIYGDGTPLDTATKTALYDVGQYMLTQQVAVPWQAGDAMLIDNASTQHARENFTPPRRILASLVGQLSKSGGVLREAELGVKTCDVSPSSSMDPLQLKLTKSMHPSHRMPQLAL